MLANEAGRQRILTGSDDPRPALDRERPAAIDVVTHQLSCAGMTRPAPTLNAVGDGHPSEQRELLHVRLRQHLVTSADQSAAGTNATLSPPPGAAPVAANFDRAAVAQAVTARMVADGRCSLLGPALAGRRGSRRRNDHDLPSASRFPFPASAVAPCCVHRHEQDTPQGTSRSRPHRHRDHQGARDEVCEEVGAQEVEQALTPQRTRR